MCWKKDKTKTFLRTTNGNIKGIQGHMASKHAEFVDKYVKQRQKVETMRKLKRPRKMDLKQQRESEQSRISLERKDPTLKKKNEELRMAKQKQFHEAQAKMKQFANNMALRQTAPQGYDDIEMAEKVLREEFTIGEPSELKFNIFSSVLLSHNFYRKCDNGARVLCLMCLRSEEKKKVFLRFGPRGNHRGLLGHMQAKHPEHEKTFHLQNEILKGLRNDKREGRL